MYGLQAQMQSRLSLKGIEMANDDCEIQSEPKPATSC
jgi:hypothetical protein